MDEETGSERLTSGLKREKASQHTPPVGEERPPISVAQQPSRAWHSTRASSVLGDGRLQQGVETRVPRAGCS